MWPCGCREEIHVCLKRRDACWKEGHVLVHVLKISNAEMASTNIFIFQSRAPDSPSEKKGARLFQTSIGEKSRKQEPTNRKTRTKKECVTASPEYRRMQGGKTTTVVASAKEAVANVGASAWSGKEKTQAVVEEKLAKARARDPNEKAAADARMQERVRQAEAAKRDAMIENAAARERAAASVHQPTLPKPPARSLDGQPDAAALPGAHLVNNNGGDNAAEATGAGDHVADAAPNATETGAAATGGHVAGAPEAVVAGNTDEYPTSTATGDHHP